MPGWLTEVLKLLGFATPFVYAAATYGVFHWLDKKASGSAKSALRAWIQSDTQIYTTNIVVGLFDRIYTYPLFRWRAFLRSAAITVTVCCLIWIEQRMFVRWATLPGNPGATWAFVVFALVFNALSDYISLFAVRYWLLLTKDRPFVSVLIGPVIGAVIVCALYYIRLLVVFTSYDLIVHGRFTLPSTMHLLINLPQYAPQDRSLFPALAVHLWLPLFGLAALATQIITRLSKAARWMQWFLKQGQHYPFQAIGYVAAIIVFVVAAIVQVVSR